MTSKLKLMLSAGLLFGSASIALGDVGPKHRTDLKHPSIKSRVQARETARASFAWSGHRGSIRQLNSTERGLADWIARPIY